MDHREIAVRVPVMNEMQFLFAQCDSVPALTSDAMNEPCDYGQD